EALTLVYEKDAAPAVSSGGRRQVLVVEDNYDAAETLQELLELFGCEVAVAHSGPEGLEAARRLRAEVVLWYIGLPGMRGYAVAASLREEPATSGAFLVAITGYGQEEDRRRAREAGFDLHLTKPIDPRELQRFLELTPQEKSA